MRQRFFLFFCSTAFVVLLVFWVISHSYTFRLGYGGRTIDGISGIGGGRAFVFFNNHSRGVGNRGLIADREPVRTDRRLAQDLELDFDIMGMGAGWGRMNSIPGGDKYFSVSAPFWLLVLLSAVYPAICFGRARRGRGGEEEAISD